MWLTNDNESKLKHFQNKQALLLYTKHYHIWKISSSVENRLAWAYLAIVKILTLASESVERTQSRHHRAQKNEHRLPERPVPLNYTRHRATSIYLPDRYTKSARSLRKTLASTDGNSPTIRGAFQCLAEIALSWTRRFAAICSGNFRNFRTQGIHELYRIIRHKKIKFRVDTRGGVVRRAGSALAPKKVTSDLW